MKNLFKTLLACLIPACSLGQVNDFDRQSKVNAIGGESASTIRQIKLEYEGVKGSPFLVKDFRPGTLKLRNGKEYKDILVNVDLVTSNVLVKQSKADNPFMVYKKELVECSIQIDFDTAVIVRKIDLPKKVDQLCVILFENQNGKAIIHPTKKILKADYSGAYNQGKNYDEIIDSYDYFFLRNDSLTIFQLKKKSIAELFPKDKEKLNAYINKKSTNLKDWAELKALFSYMMK